MHGDIGDVVIECLSLRVESDPLANMAV